MRTLGDDIKALKDAQPVLTEGAAAVPTEADAKISALAEERKELIAGGFRDRHSNWGSLLLALGVLIAIEGPVNTYIRTGKLFPGPHLYAGAGIVVLWAAAAALTPQMQKGNDTARSLHIALNCVNLALFAWQARERPFPLGPIITSMSLSAVFHSDLIGPPLALCRCPLGWK